LTAIERANQLQAQAIAILLAEREQIDTHLAQLGYGDKAALKRRGRPPKNPSQPQSDPDENKV
jgi:hypothetical protein